MLCFRRFPPRFLAPSPTIQVFSRYDLVGTLRYLQVPREYLGQLGALNAESFFERCLSCANLVVTNGNILLLDEEVSMLVELRMNVEFIERKHYAHLIVKHRPAENGISPMPIFLERPFPQFIYTNQTGGGEAPPAKWGVRGKFTILRNRNKRFSFKNYNFSAQNPIL